MPSDIAMETNLAEFNSLLSCLAMLVTDLSNVLPMIEIGVDNIITDDPECVRSLLNTWN